jgi:hypothetical protein
MGPRTGLDAVEYRKIPCSRREYLVIHPHSLVAILTDLSGYETYENQKTTPQCD